MTFCWRLKIAELVRRWSHQSSRGQIVEGRAELNLVLEIIDTCEI